MACFFFIISLILSYDFHLSIISFYVNKIDELKRVGFIIILFLLLKKIYYKDHVFNNYCRFITYSEY